MPIEQNTDNYSEDLKIFDWRISTNCRTYLDDCVSDQLFHAKDIHDRHIRVIVGNQTRSVTSSD